MPILRFGRILFSQREDTTQVYGHTYPSSFFLSRSIRNVKIYFSDPRDGQTNFKKKTSAKMQITMVIRLYVDDSPVGPIPSFTSAGLVAFHIHIYIQI